MADGVRLHTAAQKENGTEHRVVLHKYEETPDVKRGVGLHTFLEGERCPIS